MADERTPMDGRDQSKEGEHVTFLEAGLGLEGLSRQQTISRSSGKGVGGTIPVPHI
jgi:hypothetical protein